MDTILFTLEIIEYIIVRDGLVIRNEPFIFITVKANERACRHLQKTILMQKIATPKPTVLLNGQKSTVRICCVTQLQFELRSCRADRRNIACSSGILRGNRRHLTLDENFVQDLTPSEDSSDLEITWVVLVYKH